MTSGETAGDIPAIAAPTTDLARTRERYPATEEQHGKLRDLLLAAKSGIVKAGAFESYPEGSQFRIRGQGIRTDSPVFSDLLGISDENKFSYHRASPLMGNSITASARLGIFNIIPGKTPDAVLIEFLPDQAEGKPFLIEIGDTDITIESEVNPQELQEALSILFKNGAGLNHDEDSPLHISRGQGSLRFLNRDGTVKSRSDDVEDTSEIQGGHDRHELLPGKSDEVGGTE